MKRVHKAKKFIKFVKSNSGDILVSALVFAAVAVTVITGLVNWGATTLAGIRATAAKEQAFQIAEAGIDYYRWHLAQFPTDYQDGTGAAGPYNHSFFDKNGSLLGGYSLTITPPPIGSTEVIITSTGTSTANASVKRVVQAALAEPSLAQYAVVANDYMRFGSGTTINGQVTSNRGMHFDTGSLANNIVSSAVATDTDPDSGSTEWGVWTDADPAYSKTTSAPTSTQGVFMVGRQYPVPATDFQGLLSNLNTLYNATLSSGHCNSPSCWKSSSKNGYYMHLNSNNTFDMYYVNSLVPIPSGCGNSTWSVNTLSSKIGTYTIPANGVIFVEDNLWVDGTINGTRVTIAAGFGSNGLVPSITINNNLLYTNTNGNDMIGLIAQNNINAGMISADNLTIDGALVAENGRVGRFYYTPYVYNNYSRTWSGCGTGGRSNGTGGTDYSTRSTLNLNGMIITAIRYGFAYTDGTGYTNRYLNYDANLLYAPPPQFPLASTQYQLVFWKQLQ